MQNPRDLEISRRDLMIVGAASVVATAMPPNANAQGAVAGASAVSGAPVMSKVSLSVNGAAHELELDTRTTLLDALRELCISPAARRAAITANAALAP